MKKNLLLAIGLTAFTLIPAVSAKAGKPVSCGSDVTNLTVTIEGTPTDPSIYKITSDGKGAYVNTNKTGLSFQVSNCTYDFTMNLTSSRTINVVNLPTAEFPTGKTTSSGFNFDRIASVPITDGGAAYTNWCNGGVIRTNDSYIVAPNSDGNRQDNYAPCGFDEEGNFARRHVRFGLGSYGLVFQNSPIDGQGGGLANDTVLIKVHHPNANTWTLEPDDHAYFFTAYTPPSGYFDSNIPFAEWCALVYTPNSGTQVKVGNSISMPFKITVTMP